MDTTREKVNIGNKGDSNATTDPMTVASTLAQSADHLVEMRRIVREAIFRRKQALVFYLARALEQGYQSAASVQRNNVDLDAEGWEKIESLSQLRSVVGGRFQNLKKKWVEAGFPLREHRGDRGGIEIEISQQGWLELAVWVSGQGYEVRLADSSSAWFFEVRKLKKSS